jgi:hypothetical protein
MQSKISTLSGNKNIVPKITKDQERGMLEKMKVTQYKSFFSKSLKKIKEMNQVDTLPSDFIIGN